MTVSREQLAGVFSAMVTPTTASGEVDEAALRALAARLIDNTVTGLVPVGGTGEYTPLSPASRRRAVEITIEAAAGRVPVVPGVLSPGYAEAIEAGREFAAAGADGLLLLTPFYATSTQDRIREYFKRYAGEVGVPLLLYEIPSRTGVSLAPRTVEGMVDDGSIIGMKACSTDLASHLDLVRRVGERMAVLGGEEPFFATHVAMGATGGILATSNLIPRLWTEVFIAARERTLREAMAIQSSFSAFLDAVFAERNPGPLKAALALAGFPVGDALLPLGPPTAEVLARLEPLVAQVMERERALTVRTRSDAAD